MGRTRSGRPAGRVASVTVSRALSTPRTAARCETAEFWHTWQTARHRHRVSDSEYRETQRLRQTQSSDRDERPDPVPVQRSAPRPDTRAPAAAAQQARDEASGRHGTGGSGRAHRHTAHPYTRRHARRGTEPAGEGETAHATRHGRRGRERGHRATPTGDESRETRHTTPQSPPCAVAVCPPARGSAGLNGHYKRGELSATRTAERP